MSDRIRFNPNPKKILEALVWIADEHPGLGPYHFAKILYYADKAHLQRYARPILGDRYIAMPNGPVPSLAYDMLKREPGFDPDFAKEISDALAVKKNRNGWPKVSSRRKPDLRLFSETDRQCLSAAMAQCSGMSFPALRKATHNEPAYEEAETNGEMDYLLMIDPDTPNREEIIEEIMESAAYIAF